MSAFDPAAAEAIADEELADPSLDPEADLANEHRGEVDLVLNETRFVLRPSHSAMVAIEKRTGKSCLALATLTADGQLTLADATTITVECIKAWGSQVGDQVAANVDAERIGELIHEYGLMRVVLRLELVLLSAVTGGCKADGTPKEGEARPTTGADATPGVGKPDSRRPRSAGPRKRSGGQRHTSSGRPSNAGKK